VLLYISAATDLVQEREILGRAVTEIPVGLGWRIIHSPSRDEPVNDDALVRADLHLLLLGSDIRAPIGLEWHLARRAGRRPVPLLKQDVLRTPAAQSFVRFLGAQATWRPFKNLADLRFQALELLTDRLLEGAATYALSLPEMTRLQEWLAELGSSGGGVGSSERGGAGESGVVIAPERFLPSEGILIQRGDGSDSQ
jgi:hypothetical protein